MGFTVPAISIGAIFYIFIHLLLGGIFAQPPIIESLALRLKPASEILVTLHRVVLLSAHQIFIDFGHGYFVTMKRASSQEILFSRGVHTMICNLSPQINFLKFISKVKLCSRTITRNLKISTLIFRTRRYVGQNFLPTNWSLTIGHFGICTQFSSNQYKIKRFSCRSLELCFLADASLSVSPGYSETC